MEDKSIILSKGQDDFKFISEKFYMSSRAKVAFDREKTLDRVTSYVTTEIVRRESTWA